MSPALPRLRRRGRWAALVAVLLLALVFAAAHATWLRPLIQHHVQEQSGRRIDFDSLHFGLDRSLRPTVRLHNLYVENAPWAAARPLVRAAEVRFTVAWQSLLGERLIIPRIVLVDAEFDLERQADGLRNWRLNRPGNRGPGRVRVLSVDAQRTQARIVHRGMDLEMTLQIAPLDDAERVVPPAGPALTKAIAFRGTRGGAAFEGRALVSEVLSLFDTGEPFGLQARLQTAQAQVRATGTARDLLSLGGLDVELQLSGGRMENVARLLGLPAKLPPLAADLRGHLRKEDGRWDISGMRARWGGSDVAGTLAFDESAGGDARPRLTASFTSERLRLDEWYPGTGGGRHDFEALRSVDAEVDWRVGALQGPVFEPLERLRAHAALSDGRLRLAPLEFALAGGRATGSLTLDAAPAGAAVDLQFSGLELARLARRGAPQLQGALDLRVAMRARGDSAAALAAAASGSVKAELVRATIPALLDAKLGLDGGRWLRSWFSGGDRQAITCSLLELQFEAGKGRTRRLVFETDRVAVSGSGAVDLANQTFEAVLVPRRKQAALLALDRAMRVQGPLFRVTQVSLVDAQAGARADACAPAPTQ